MRPLNIGSTAAEALKLPVHAFRPVMNNGWPILLAIVALGWIDSPWGRMHLNDLTQPLSHDDMDALYSGPVNAAIDLVRYILNVLLLAVVIRVVLLSEPENPDREGFRLGRADFLCGIGFLILTIPVALLGVFLVSTGFMFSNGYISSLGPWKYGFAVVPASIVILTATCRLLVLPAMGAMGKQPRLKEAWTLTAGQFGKFLTLAVVSALVWLFLNTFFSSAYVLLYWDVFDIWRGKQFTSAETSLSLASFVFENYVTVTIIAGLSASLYRQLFTVPPVDVSAFD